MIVNANPEIFDENYEEGCEDWEQLTLTLALLFEIIKGKFLEFVLTLKHYIILPFIIKIE